MNKKYIVRLTAEERRTSRDVVKQLKGSSQKARPAQMLLKADMGQPVQLVKETRPPIPATKRHAQRIGYEYDRTGTANIFRFTEPLRGWREATARTTKTKIDWAVEVARLLEGRYAKCATVILVVRRLRF